MRHKFLAVVLIILFTLSTAGCMKKNVQDTSSQADLVKMQKFVVVVVDKASKAPIKDAKVYLVGDDTVYTTDEMGKTPEIQTEINKGYFNRYTNGVPDKMNCGLTNLVVLKDGYGRHFEMDSCLYPGDAVGVVKVGISKGNKLTHNLNTPDISYIDNVIKAYEKFEGQPAKVDNMMKYKVKVVDEKNSPLEGVKVIIPEGMSSHKTDKNGICEFEIPYDSSEYSSYPVKKDYEEITLLAYKQGFTNKAVFKAHLNKEGKENSIILKMKKSSREAVDYEFTKPSIKWVEEILKSYK